MTMARVSDTESDVERGLYLDAGNHECHMLTSSPRTPNGSSTSERTDRTDDTMFSSGIGSAEDALSLTRDTEISVATPNKPLLATHHHGDPDNYYHGNNNYNPEMGSESMHVSGRQINNGHAARIPKSGWSEAKESHDGVQRKKRGIISRLYRGREHWCCLCGVAFFILGLVLLIIATILYINTNAGSSSMGTSGPCLGESVGEPDVHRDPDSSPSYGDNSQKSAPPATTTTTTTEPTTTFSYEGLENLAAGLSDYAFQSSSHSDGDVTYSASLAVDASEDHTFAGGSCSLTEPQLRPFWRLDLGTYRLVRRFRIYTPTDCCHNSLVDFEVRIGQSEELSNNALCQHVKDAQEGVVEVVCARQIYGRYVSIQLIGSDGTYRQLALCYVQIYTT